MNSRERMLMLLVGSCLVMLLGYWSISTVMGWFEFRDQRLETLRKDLRKKKDELTRVQIAAKKLTDYETRSLPREVDVAQSLYQTWLLNIAAEAKLADVTLVTQKPRANQRTFHTLGFTFAARGNLPQTVDWLHRFQSEDRLHRLDSFSIKPLKNSKDLQISAVISAVSVNSAPSASALTPLPKKNWPALASFQEPILNRNLFGPPNQAPRFASDSPPKAYLGRSFDFTTKATDSDTLDRLTFALLKGSDGSVRYDATSGRLSWTPKALGEFEFELQASDDGLPAKTAKQTYKIVVTDPPPPPAPVAEGPKKLAFDQAKYTVLTAVLEVNGTAEAWLHNRISAEIQKLHSGDIFTIGSISGKVRAVDSTAIEYESQGKLWRLVQGQLLSEAAVVDVDN